MLSLFVPSLLLFSAAMGAPFQPSDPVPSNATTPSPTNGTIPSPLQPGVPSNCDAYYYVQPGDFCANAARASGITLEEFLTWNPQAGDTCANLLADAWACVSVVGHTPTPVNPPNGIETPQPIQDGMVGNCNKFHFVEGGDTCPAIQKLYGVSLEDLVMWNPAIRADCSLMWGGTNLCVGVVA